ncbi:MAG TPA: L-threonylcarbamoyladenylate synthase [Thermoplasmata archaeon]|nr:L-threonylcarbamoyladenylate synthase [Thermoplasmata archaeon]
MGGSIDDGVRALRAGRLVVYPTDTLYGLGARASSTLAVGRLVRAKERPGGMPISIMLSSTEELEEFAALTETMRAWVRRLLPGPVTVIVPSSPAGRSCMASPIVGPSGKLGVRVPDHPAAREIARRVGPVTCTSANRHGAPPAVSLAQARSAFGGDVAEYVRGGPAPSGRPSMLVDLTHPAPAFVERARR